MIPIIELTLHNEYNITIKEEDIFDVYIGLWDSDSSLPFYSSKCVKILTMNDYCKFIRYALGKYDDR